MGNPEFHRKMPRRLQPPIAASGFSSQAFAPHYPHTERKIETKTCSDCHISQANDNNAIMAQLMLQGTNFVNFVGYNAWVGEEKGVAAVQVTEWEEPQAVILPGRWQRRQGPLQEPTGMQPFSLELALTRRPQSPPHQ